MESAAAYESTWYWIVHHSKEKRVAEILSVTAALKQESIPLHAQSVLQMMAWAGLVEEIEYVSSTGSGEIKFFQRLTETGLKYGVNLPTLSSVKTEIKINPKALASILKECHEAFGKYVAQLHSE